MAAISVTVGNSLLARISTESRNIVAVSVHGDMIGGSLATLEATGGHYENSIYSDHRIFIDSHEINDGDIVEISFSESELDPTLGQTIDELCLNETDTNEDPKTDADIWRGLRAQTKLRGGVLVEFHVPNEEVTVYRTPNDSDMYSINAIWDWTKPDQVRVSFSSTSYAALEAGQNGITIKRSRLLHGESLSFQLKAL